MKYWYSVYADWGARVTPRKKTSEEFRDVADAMAAWSKAISEGAEYVTLEALKECGQ